MEHSSLRSDSGNDFCLIHLMAAYSLAQREKAHLTLKRFEVIQKLDGFLSTVATCSSSPQLPDTLIESAKTKRRRLAEGERFEEVFSEQRV